MRIVIGYPPLESKKGTALLSQNRQFQWFSSPTYIYPIIPASAATLLKQNGFQVTWLDGIAENWTYQQWLARLKKAQPDLLFIETKTPVIKAHWQIINNLKKQQGATLRSMKIVLAGDHVTAFPKESFQNCPVDYIITGGHYDTALLNLVTQLNKNSSCKKIWHGSSPDLNKLPFIDRKLTKWHLYAYKNGNFKYLPATYTMAGRDCWWRKEGGCTFCSWTALFPQFSVRTPENLLDEIGQLIKLGVKEVFDDTGTFMVGTWLENFCQGMIKRDYHKKIAFGCNMRYEVLTKKQYQLMAQANFRFILYGLESVNLKTIKKLNKGTNPAKIKAEMAIVKQASKEVNGQLEPHVTCMVGYPWETYQDTQDTVNFTKSLFKKGLIDSLQATICIPYPGTKLFNQCLKNNWLVTRNWNRYDMRKPIMKIPYPKHKLMKLVRSIYTSAITPRFLVRKFTSIRSLDDIKFLIRSTRQFLGHLLDFLPL